MNTTRKLQFARNLADSIAIVSTLATVISIMIFAALTSSDAPADIFGQPIFMASALAWAAITFILIVTRITISGMIREIEDPLPRQSPHI